MPRGCGIAIVVGAAVAVGAQCLGEAAALPARSAGTIVLGMKQDGTTIRPHVGDALVVRLAGNPTTGYRWVVQRLPRALRAVSSAYVPSAPGRLGQGGTYVFRFVVRSGHGTVRFAYRRSWERGKPPLRTFSVTVRTR